MKLFLSRCRNSMGSSMVIMWSARVALTRSMMAARVVDLPEPVVPVTSTKPRRSEEHTSELQSRGHLVCRLLLEKKKQRQQIQRNELQRFTNHIYVLAPLTS